MVCLSAWLTDAQISIQTLPEENIWMGFILILMIQHMPNKLEWEFKWGSTCLRAKANTRTAGRGIIVTNGLSVRQERGCGWLFYHTKKNRLCLSFYSIQRDSVILEVLALFMFAFPATVVRHQELSKCVVHVSLLRTEWPYEKGMYSCF